ncbi:MAG: RodZ domain-containing protein [Bacteriovorax sp.]
MTEETTTNENIETTETHELPATSPMSSFQTIGELLRETREARGLSLKTISQQTKIHIGLLGHLENDDLSKLPSKTYVRGFVKSAAKILGIGQEYALDILEATYNRGRPALKKETPNVEMRNEAARNTLSSITATPIETVKSVTASSSTFLAKSAVVLLIVGVVGFNVKNLIDRSAEENMKLPEVLSTIHQKIKPAPKPAAPKPVQKVETVKAPEAPIAVNIIPDKKDVLKSEVTIKDVNLKNISLGEKQFTEDTSITGEKLEEIFPARYRVHPTKGVENVFINAVDGDSWVTYKVDDKEIKKFVLRQGRTVFLRGEKIRLFLGNTKSVKIFYNNKLLNINAKGNVKNLVFPEEMKTKYMSPLFIFQKDGSVVTSDEFIKENQPAKAPAAPAKPVAPAPAPAAAPAKKL